MNLENFTTGALINIPMKINQLNPSYFQSFGQLNEANVLNADPSMEYDGYSIKKYLEHYLQYLTSDQAKKMFVTKLGKLFMNDERYHHVVRELPPTAPKWAHEAKRKKELVYFKADANLDDIMQHLAHYVDALEHDSQSPNNDIKAFANREIAGFPKAENIDMLAKKSQEYFKRGTKKTDRSEEGMKQIYDAGDGFKWYLLQTPEAYQREGKALQNCIGSYYTRANSRDRGFEIVVMRKGNNESVVAARIGNKSNEIEEMKGKNNRPPVEKYMHYVLSFMNNVAGGLKLNRSAESDFRRAGYFYIDDIMHTRSQAITKYIKKDVIAKLPDGNELIRVKTDSGSKIVEELFRDLYPELHTGYGKKPEIYELRNSENVPLISGAVEGKKLEKIQRHSSLRESLIESVIQGRASREFVGELIRRKIIDSVNDKMARDLFWNERIKINQESGTFDPVQPEKDVPADKVTWEKHSDNDTVKMIRQSLEAASSSGSWSDDGKWEPLGVHKVYVTKEKMVDSEHDDFEKHSKHFAMALTKDSVLVPIEINMNNDRVSTTDVGTGTGSNPDGTDSQVRRSKLINAAVALANTENAKLTKSFKYNSGIVRDGKKYKVFDPKVEKLPGKPTGVKLDLSKVPLGDRFAAINRVIIAGGIRSRDGAATDADHINDHDTEVQLKLDYALSGEKKYARGQSLWQSVSQEDASNWEGHDADKLYTKVFNGDSPDTIYLVKVKYGTNKSHEVFMLTAGHKVVEIDGATERHEFQNWGDHELVANQLNDFADKQGLTFDPSSIGDKEELRVSGGRIATGSMIQKKQLEDMKAKGDIGQEGTDEVSFEDGAKLARMDREEQAEWVRRGLDVRSVKGEGWKVLNKAGDHIGVVVVAKNTIEAIYGPDFDWDSDSGSMVPGKELVDMTNKQSISPELLGYTLGAKTSFKWKAKAAQQFTISSHSDHHNILKAAEANKDVQENAYFHKVYDLGLIKAEDVTGHKKKVSLTSAGKAALKKLNKGDNVNALTLGKGSKLA